MRMVDIPNQTQLFLQPFNPQQTHNNDSIIPRTRDS